LSRAAFERLVATAHVFVSGLRPGALDGLGYDRTALRALNPAVITASHNAYGWTGPWQGRRGFDSLVQMSSGIAARGQAVHRSERPVPLPAQALDHATGYLLAAGVCRALCDLRAGRTTSIRASLARTAQLLVELVDPGRRHEDVELFSVGFGNRQSAGLTLFFDLGNGPRFLLDIPAFFGFRPLSQGGCRRTDATGQQNTPDNHQH
jgi:hypothetical protein